MFNFFYKNYRNLIFLHIFFSFSFLQAQDQKNIPEKVYLQTDRSIYFLGEDLWYKAYVVNAYNNLLYDNSNVLYVELVSPDSKIVARNKTNLELGLGNGDFRLKDSLGIKPGHYLLRAYTNWNRNFGDDFLFKKEIEIFEIFEDHSNSNKTPNSVTTIKTKTIETNKQNTFNADFFPEGGSLLENVNSVIGFKAVDINGKPIEVKGEIYDSDNKLITFFSSVHDGMGKFEFVPIEDKKYFAKIQNPAEEEIKVELPNVLKTGYLVSFRVMKGRNIVSVRTNQVTLSQNPNGQLTVVCKAKGIPYLESTLTLIETSLSFELPKDKTPDGISQITLLDNTNKPQSERLIYIEKDQDLDVKLLTDKESYQPNEKVTINVSSKSKTGIAKSASFSLSVTDMNGGVKDKDFDTNISSYFLIESDIRGKVYNPAYYFDASNSKRLEYLDNLLLTQGWRDFVWKTMPKAAETSPYKVEKGINISGRVQEVHTDKPVVNNYVTLALSGKKNNGIFSTITDSIGHFQFENLLFSGETNMFLNTRNQNGKFNGKIVLDSIEHAPVRISFKKELINWNASAPKIVENVFMKYVGLDVKSKNILEEVAIVSRKKDTSTFFTMSSGLTDKVYFKIPGFSYKAGTDSDIRTFTDIFDFIIKKIPNVRAFENSVSFSRYINPPLFFLNHEIASYEQIAIISPVDVKEINAYENTEEVSKHLIEAPWGIIFIWTKPFTGNQLTKNPLSSFNKRIEGFYNSRVFYSPDPEKNNFELDNIVAVRNTIYWNPYVHPDKTGNANVNFYNTKVETKVKVALEGITGSGIPVVKNVYYNIKR